VIKTAPPLALALILACQLVSAADLTRQQAIRLAEKYVLENGYTAAPRSQVKRQLDPESLKFSSDVEENLRMRYNTLRPKAIGARLDKGRRYGKAWSVAFDYAGPTRYADICRIVTMKPDGSGIYMEHVEGDRLYFADK